MKRVIIALAIMGIMLLSCIGVLFWLHESILTLESDLDAAQALFSRQQIPEAMELLDSAAHRWEKQEHIFARLLRHKELESITMNLVSLSAYLEHRDYASFAAADAQIRLMLTHIWEAELPLPENLL